MIKFSNQQLTALAEIRGLGLDAVSVRSPEPAAAGPKTARGGRRGRAIRARPRVRHIARYDSRLDDASRVGKASTVKARADP
jgi:hypothetical protein